MNVRGRLAVQWEQLTFGAPVVLGPRQSGFRIDPLQCEAEEEP